MTNKRVASISKKCLTPPCERPSYRRNPLCFYHYKKEMRENAPLPTREQVAEHFWKYVTRPSDPNECWGWLGPVLVKRAGGYGYISINYRSLKAHRISFYLHNFFPAPDCVLHACDNPICTNPLHLRSGSQSENMQDARDRNRFAQGSDSSNARLTEADIPVIRKRLTSGEKISAIATDYSVNYMTIYDVRRRRTWGHII